jgi:hypothetical protein
MDADESVDGSAPSTASWKTRQTGFPTAPTPRVRRYAIAERISWVVVDTAGCALSFIDSALK